MIWHRRLAPSRICAGAFLLIGVLLACYVLEGILPGVVLRLMVWLAILSAGIAAGFGTSRPAAQGAYAVALGFGTVCAGAQWLSSDPADDPQAFAMIVFTIVLAGVGAIAAATTDAFFIRRPARIAAERRKRGLCVKCEYDLTGNTSGVCPECGTPIDVSVRPSREHAPPKNGR